MTHDLKTFPDYFGAVLSGKKPFEVRLNDRDYQVGDVLHLMEYFKDTDSYGMDDFFDVTYILKDKEFVKDGYVIMSIQPKDRKETLRKYTEWELKK